MHKWTKSISGALLTVSAMMLCAQNAREHEQQLRAAAEHEPNSARAAGALGEFYFHEQRWQASARWLQKAYALSGGDEALGYDLASAWLNMGAPDRARVQIEAMQAHKDSAQLHSLMAQVDDRSGAYREAAQEYHRAAEMEPTEEHIFDLATYLVQHKQYVGALEDAIKFYHYGVQMFPASARMRIGLGVALYAASEYDEAVRELCAAVDLDPKDTRSLQFLGRAGKVSPDLAHAVDARLKEFAERYPENAAANYFYALALWERGGGEQGQGVAAIVRLLEKSEALAPKWYEPHYQLGVVYESQKRYADALREMQSAVVIDPDFFPAHYQLARLYNRAGQREKAEVEATLVQRLKAKDESETIHHDVTE